MRISLNKDDPWLTSFPSSYKVYLNGKELNGCIMADTKLGLIEAYCVDSNGDYYISSGKDYIETCFLAGNVSIEFLFLEMIKSIYYKIRYRA